MGRLRFDATRKIIEKIDRSPGTIVNSGSASADCEL